MSNFWKRLNQAVAQQSRYGTTIGGPGGFAETQILAKTPEGREQLKNVTYLSGGLAAGALAPATGAGLAGTSIAVGGTRFATGLALGETVRKARDEAVMDGALTYAVGEGLKLAAPVVKKVLPGGLVQNGRPSGRLVDVKTATESVEDAVATVPRVVRKALTKQQILKHLSKANQYTRYSQQGGFTPSRNVVFREVPAGDLGGVYTDAYGTPVMFFRGQGNVANGIAANHTMGASSLGSGVYGSEYPMVAAGYGNLGAGSSPGVNFMYLRAKNPFIVKGGSGGKNGVINLGKDPAWRTDILNAAGMPANGDINYALEKLGHDAVFALDDSGRVAEFVIPPGHIDKIVPAGGVETQLSGFPRPDHGAQLHELVERARRGDMTPGRVKDIARQMGWTSQDAKGGKASRAAIGGGETGGESAQSANEVPEGTEQTVQNNGGPRIIVNPSTFRNEKDALCVAMNEAFRIIMEVNGFDPVSEPTERQRKFFSDTAYNDDELMLRRTILARICTFDTSVKDPTDEQLQEAMEFLDTVMEIGAPQNEWEQQAVKRIRDTIGRAVGQPRAEEPSGVE